MLTQYVTDEHKDAQYARLISLIKETFGEDSPRTTALLKMYSDFEDLVKWAPASGKVHYHNAYEGGYLDHVLLVADIAIKQATIYKQFGGKINFTKEELIFAALHHDLGKLGDEEGPYYTPESSDWHRKNQNSRYRSNKEITYLTVFDRTMYLLSQYGVTFTKNELLGIRLADGLYMDANKPYLLSESPFPFKSNIGYLLHWADHMATIIEKGRAQAMLESENE